MPRVITNKSNVYTEDQRNLLYFYAAKVIRGSFQIDELVNVAWLRYCRYSEENKRGKVIKFEMYKHMAKVESGNMATLDTEETTVHPTYFEDLDKESMKDLLDLVSDKRKRVLAKLHYLKGFKYRELAKMFNITNQAVSWHIKGAREEIKERRAEDYW